MINFRYVMMSAASVFAMLYFGTGAASAQEIRPDLCYPVKLACDIHPDWAGCISGSDYGDAVTNAINARHQSTGELCDEVDPGPFEPVGSPTCAECNKPDSTMHSFSFVRPCPPHLPIYQVTLSVCFSNGQSIHLYGLGHSRCSAQMQAQYKAQSVARKTGLQICSWCISRSICMHSGCATSPSNQRASRKIRKRCLRIQRRR